MTLPQSLVVATADVAAPAAESAPAVINLQTALLIVVAVILVFLFKALSDVRIRLDRLESGASPAPRHDRGESGQGDEAIPDRIVAVIAAAVVTAVGRGHRIVSLQPVTPEARAWSLEGRRQVFQSHQVR